MWSSLATCEELGPASEMRGLDTARMGRATTSTVGFIIFVELRVREGWKNTGPMNGEYGSEAIRGRLEESRNFESWSLMRTTPELVPPTQTTK
ncbi:hypothetical protein TNCV_4376341 [Trichonephila clavipes]|nr:hypothetical protein TNCV_4376341 [Trichonephila clavipes]